MQVLQQAELGSNAAPSGAIAWSKKDESQLSTSSGNDIQVKLGPLLGKKIAIFSVTKYIADKLILQDSALERFKLQSQIDIEELWSRID